MSIWIAEVKIKDYWKATTHAFQNRQSCRDFVRGQNLYTKWAGISYWRVREYGRLAKRKFFSSNVYQLADKK